MDCDACRGHNCRGCADFICCSFDPTHFDIRQPVVKAGKFVRPSGFCTSYAWPSCADAPADPAVISYLRTCRICHWSLASHLIKAIAHGLFLRSELLYKSA